MGVYLLEALRDPDDLRHALVASRAARELPLLELASCLRAIFDAGERFTIRGSEAVIYICPYLGHARRSDRSRQAQVLDRELTACGVRGEVPPEAEVVARLRKELGLDVFVRPSLYRVRSRRIKDSTSCTMRSPAWCGQPIPTSDSLMVGGKDDQVARRRKRDVERFGVTPHVVFTGQTAAVRDAALSRGGRRPRLTALSWQEHAAQNLFVSQERGSPSSRHAHL